MTVRKESKEIIVLRVGMTLIVLFREYVYVYASVSRGPGRVGALNDKGYDQMGVLPVCRLATMHLLGQSRVNQSPSSSLMSSMKTSCEAEMGGLD